MSVTIDKERPHVLCDVSYLFEYTLFICMNFCCKNINLPKHLTNVLGEIRISLGSAKFYNIHLKISVSRFSSIYAIFQLRKILEPLFSDHLPISRGLPLIFLLDGCKRSCYPAQTVGPSDRGMTTRLKPGSNGGHES